MFLDVVTLLAAEPILSERLGSVLSVILLERPVFVSSPLRVAEL